MNTRATPALITGASFYKNISFTDFLAEQGQKPTADKLLTCSKHFALFNCLRCNSEHEKRVPLRCGVRVGCPTCSNIAHRKLWHRYYPILHEHRNHLRFLTLGYGRVHYSNFNAEIKNVNSAVRKLITKLYNGALGVFEITDHPETSEFYLHYHLIVHGKYVTQNKISKVWSQFSGKQYAYIKDIRNRLTAKHLSYVLKYVRKQELTTHHSRLMYLNAIDGVRRVHSFGSLYNFNPQPTRNRFLLCPSCHEPLSYVGTFAGNIVVPVKSGGHTQPCIPPPAEKPSAENLSLWASPRLFA